MAPGAKGSDGATAAKTRDKEDRPTLIDRWERVLDGGGWPGQLLVSVLLLIFAVGSAFLLVPRSQQVVPYGLGDLGRFADGVFKADRDYTIPDQEATERKRDEARQAVKAVYDFEVTAADESLRRIHEAFALMQRLHGDYRLGLAPKPEPAPAGEEGAADPRPDGADPQHAGEAPAAGGADEQPAVSRSWAARRARKEARELSALFESRKDEFFQLLQVVLEDAEFKALAKERFSPQIERAVAGLVEELLRQPIVVDRQLLAADRERGIVIRPIPSRDSREERVIEDVAGTVRDLPAVRSSVTERMAQLLPEASPETRASATRLARRIVRKTLTFNREETQARQDAAAESVKPSVIQLQRGEKIIGDGERIERRHLIIFEGMRAEAESTDKLQAYLGAGMVALLVALSLIAFSRSSVWRFRPTRKDLIFLLTALLGTLLAARGGMFLAEALGDRMGGVSEDILYFGIPVSAAVILVRLVLSGEITLVFAAILSIFAGIVADHSLGYSVFVFVGGLVGADHVSRGRDRSGIWRAGLLMAVVNASVAVALTLLVGRFSPHEAGVAAIAAAAAGAITPLIVLGVALVVENFFRYTTDLKLLELANLNNPLLKELVVAAPGTYHHSMMLGAMVESAAEAIGANPLLARVGAYYHDIGKGKNPLYFAENQKGENLHDKLAPSMSALVIRRHVTDGVKMAKAARLPRPIIDMIPMHHGTRLMSYFWHKAKEDAERKGEPAPSETEYRHTGPKPRFREAVLLMIADSVEAASRTVTEPTTDRLRGVVQKVINSCFADGQFDECDITLKDLHAVTRSFVRSLEAIYHSRPEYQQPAEKTSKEKNGNGAKAENGNGNGKAENGKAESGEKAAAKAANGEKAPTEGGDKEAGAEKPAARAPEKTTVDAASSAEGEKGAAAAKGPAKPKDGPKDQKAGPRDEKSAAQGKAEKDTAGTKDQKGTAKAKDQKGTAKTKDRKTAAEARDEEGTAEAKDRKTAAETRDAKAGAEPEKTAASTPDGKAAAGSEDAQAPRAASKKQDAGSPGAPTSAGRGGTAADSAEPVSGAEPATLVVPVAAATHDPVAAEARETAAPDAQDGNPAGPAPGDDQAAQAEGGEPAEGDDADPAVLAAEQAEASGAGASPLPPDPQEEEPQGEVLKRLGMS